MAIIADPICQRFAESISGKTPEELIDLAYSSPAIHFACFCTIRDKDNRVIEPTPNILQLRLSEAYETLQAMGVKTRIICTKPRRAGCSTFVGHILYHHGMRQPVEGIAIADKSEHSEALLNKLSAYEGADAYDWGVKVLKDPSSSIEWSNGTKWTIDTAQNSNASVGDTNQVGFFSETSKWPQTTRKNDDAVMAAVLPTLSGPNSVAFSESTPEGATGWQYRTWQGAVTLEEFIRMHERGICPEEQWVKVFAAWFEFADNRRKNPVSAAEIEEIEATLDEEEIEGIDKYHWDWEQIAWRREIIKSVCGGDPKKFRYYYPSDDVTCWLASGSPRFDMTALAEMEAAAISQTPEIGHLVTQYRGKVNFQRDAKHGEIYIWEIPKQKLRYVVALDPATDESQTIGADPDRHSLQVWRSAYRDTAHDVWRPMKLVARLKPPFYGEGDEVAGHAVRLSKFYGNAIYCQEINCGLDILRRVREAGVPCYKRRPLSHRTGKIVEQFGFRLNDEQERTAIIEALAAAIRDRALDIPCLHAIGEYKTFVRTKSGRAEAAGGAHDDDVLCDAMAFEVQPSATEYQEPKAEHVDPPDRKGPGGWRQVNRVKRGW